MPEVKLSLLAEADLQNIWHFIAQENPKAATKVIESAYETFASLADSPKMGRLCSVSILPKIQIRS